VQKVRKEGFQDYKEKMNFYFYDITFLVIFGAFLSWFLISRRKKVQREGILFLYRTKLGLKIIDYISRKHKKFLHSFEYVLIFFGYLLMATMIFLIGQIIYLFFKFPDLIKAIKIPPVVPLIPYLPQIFKADYLPAFYFTYWIIVLAVAAISHEFLHGIFARARGIKIKSTGFAFLGPFSGAFVEPDENKVKKLPIKSQIAFLSAGTFANLVMTIVFFIILWLFFILFFAPSGVIFNIYTFSIANSSDINLTKESLFVNFDGGLNLTKVLVGNTTYYVESRYLVNNTGYVIAYEDSPALKAGLNGIIIGLDGNKINTYTDLVKALALKKPGDEVLIKTSFNNSVNEYNIKLAGRPDNENKAYLGIATIKTDSSSILSKIRNSALFFKDPNTDYEPKFAENFIIFIYNLIWWIVLVNFSVAVGNMLPLGIFDGGRVFYLTVFGITKSEKIAKAAYKFSTYLFILAFLLLTFLWFVNFPF